MKIPCKAASIVCLERVQADMYLVQARRGQKRLLPCGKQRSVRRKNDAEAKLARNFQKLRKLRMRQRLSHDMQIEIVRVRAELSGEKRKFLRRERARGALRAGAECTASVADIRDLQIDPRQHDGPPCPAPRQGGYFASIIAHAARNKKLRWRKGSTGKSGRSIRKSV